MNSKVHSTGEVARALGIRRYQLEYLIETGAVADTRTRVAGKRVWTDEHIRAIEEALAARERRRVDDGREE